jgi:hypothetical protein
MTIRKWYFATNMHGLRHAFAQIKVAVVSNRANLRLAPHCIVDDFDGDERTDERIRWLVDNGVQIIRHRASMLDVLRPRFGEQMNTFGGHWLRCDIPALETTDEFVLYTDIDVMFLKPLPDTIAYPKYVACGPEHHQNDYGYFNSGVMIMNVPALRDRRSDLVRVVQRRLPTMSPWDDQSALNELYRHTWLKLPPVWNWKPYWGPNDQALIVHFHGPKPSDVRRIQLCEAPNDWVNVDFRKIYNRNAEGYTHYIDIFEALLSST